MTNHESIKICILWKVLFANQFYEFANRCNNEKESIMFISSFIIRTDFFHTKTIYCLTKINKHDFWQGSNKIQFLLLLMNSYSSHYNHCTETFFKLVTNEFNLEYWQCINFFLNWFMTSCLWVFCLLTDHYGLLFVYFLFTPDFFFCMFSWQDSQQVWMSKIQKKEEERKLSSWGAVRCC